MIYRSVTTVSRRGLESTPIRGSVSVISRHMCELTSKIIESGSRALLLWTLLSSRMLSLTSLSRRHLFGIRTTTSYAPQSGSKSRSTWPSSQKLFTLLNPKEVGLKTWGTERQILMTIKWILLSLTFKRFTQTIGLLLLRLTNYSLRRQQTKASLNGRTSSKMVLQHWKQKWPKISNLLTPFLKMRWWTLKLNSSLTKDSASETFPCFQMALRVRSLPRCLSLRYLRWLHKWPRILKKILQLELFMI